MRASQVYLLACFALMSIVLHFTSVAAANSLSVGKGHRPAKRLSNKASWRRIRVAEARPPERSKRAIWDLSPVQLLSPAGTLEEVTSDSLPNNSGGSSSQGNPRIIDASNNDGAASNVPKLAADTVPQKVESSLPVKQSLQNTSESLQGAQSTSPTVEKNRDLSLANSQNSATDRVYDTKESKVGDTSKSDTGAENISTLKTAPKSSLTTESNSNSISNSSEEPNKSNDGTALSATNESTGNSSNSKSVTNTNGSTGSTVGKSTSEVGKTAQGVQETTSTLTNGTTLLGAPIVGTSSKGYSSAAKSESTDKGSDAEDDGRVVYSANSTTSARPSNLTETVLTSARPQASVGKGGQGIQPSKSNSNSATKTNSTNAVLGTNAASGTVVDLGGSNDQPVVSVPDVPVGISGDQPIVTIPATNVSVLSNTTHVAPVVVPPIVVGTKLPLPTNSDQGTSLSEKTTPISSPLKSDSATFGNGGNIPDKTNVPTPTPLQTDPPTNGANNGSQNGNGSGPVITTVDPVLESNPTTAAPDTITMPMETSATTSSKDSSQSAFGYANQQKLLLHDDTSKSDSISGSANKTSTGATSDSKSADKPLNSISINIPSVIAPTGAGQVSLSSPDVVSVSILFKATLDWNTLASSPDLVAQIFLFMPGIIAACVSIPVENVTTIRLQRQISAASGLAKRDNSSSNSGQSLYVANVPTSVSTTLQQQINDPTSTFYTQSSNPVAKELVSQVEPSYNIMQNVTVPSDSSDSSQKSNSNGNGTLRKALIAIGTLLAICIVAFIIQYFQRASKHKKEKRLTSSTGYKSTVNGLKYRDTIQTFGSVARNDLHETWAPNGHEQHQVFHGELTEAWDHTEVQQAHDGLLTMGHYSPVMMENNSSALSLQSARDVMDPFSDMAANKAEQETERLHGHNMAPRDTLLSHLALPTTPPNDISTDSYRSVKSNSSRMTEAQRILQDYFENRQNSQEATTSHQDNTPAEHLSEVVPAQYTANHTYGPRAIDHHQIRRQPSKNSIAKNAVGQPTMQRNSVLI